MTTQTTRRPRRASAPTAPALDTNILKYAAGLRFGVELETVGHTREYVANRLARHLGNGAVAAEMSTAGQWRVTMADGRVWSVLHDGSLTGARTRGGSANPTASVGEVVSPILGVADLPMLASVVRILGKIGCGTDDSCGIHVHVEARGLNAGAIARLVTLVGKQDEVLEAALGITSKRRMQYAKRLPLGVVEALQALPTDAPREDVMRAWFASHNNEEREESRYNSTRYHGLNLHSILRLGTVEFRWFEPSLRGEDKFHAGEIASYVWLCLALVAKATLAKRVNGGTDPILCCVGKTYESKRAQAMRDLLWSLGFLGESWKTLRAHLTRRLIPATAPNYRAAQADAG